MQSRVREASGALRSFSVSFQKSSVLRAALDTGLLARLARHAGTLDELSTALDLDPEGVGRTLDCLAAMDLVKADEDGRWYPSAGVALITDPSSPHHLGNHLLQTTQQMANWLYLEDTLHKGPRSDRGLGSLRLRGSFVEFLIEGGRDRVSTAVDIVAKTLTPGVDRVLIPLGGSGEYVAAVRAASPHAYIDVVEHPAMVRRILPGGASGDRVEVRTLQNLPSTRDYDAIVLADITRSLSVLKLRSLLSRIGRKLREGGEILVVDVFQESDLAAFLPWLNMSLYVNTRSGKIRSTSELGDIANESGLAMQEPVHVKGATGIILRKAELWAG